MDAKEEAIAKAVQLLIEHFDSVQVMCSVTEDGMTSAHYLGGGDFYARLGLAHEFIESDKSKITARDLGNAIRNEEE